MDATQSFFNMLAVVAFVGLALSPFILVGLLVSSVRKNNAKRRQAEQERQAKAFAEAVIGLSSVTGTSVQDATHVMQQAQQSRITEPQKLKVIRADGKRPWYLR